MSNEEKKVKINELLQNTQLKCLKVENINHKPHIFMITPKHLTNSKGMYLEADSAPCGMPDCRLSYKEHTSDNVAFLQLTRNSTNDELNKTLQKLVEDLGEKFVDGFVFVKNEFEIT
jgi:hypothetical protein